MTTHDTTHDPAAQLRPLNAQLSPVEYLTAMWDRRDFAIAMPVEELRSTHQNTLLGNIWHLGNPMLTVGVYYLVFGVILKSNRGIDNYVLWLTVGVFAFQLTSSTITAGANSIAANQGLMRSIRFPRALLPISVVLSRLITFAFQLGVLGVVALLTGAGVSQRWVMLPVVLAVHTAFNLGGAFIAARLNDAFRDVQQLIPYVFHLLRYVSGVMFPLTAFLSASDHPLMRRYVQWNPLRQILDLYRWVFLGTPISLSEVVQITAVSTVLLWVGFAFFRGAEWRYGRN